MTRALGGASEYDFIFKLVLIGDSSVGKVGLINRKI
jgi:GTPase SAR1 family protein